MFGYSTEPNNWKYNIGNFLVVLAVQIIYELYEGLRYERFPTPFEAYKIFIVSIVVTIGFFGLNKYVQRRK